MRPLLCLVIIGLAPACATGTTVCKRDTITGSEQCQDASDNYGAAAATGAAAGAAWAVVGCTVNGCAPPSYCNTRTKQCEVRRCTDDGECDAGFHCDTTAHSCQ